MAVLMEDSAAVAGVLLASASILLTHFTGNVVYDAVGSITIGGGCGTVDTHFVHAQNMGRTEELCSLQAFRCLPFLSRSVGSCGPLPNPAEQ